MLSPEDLEPVPDVHHRIPQLEEQLQRLRVELTQSQEAARKAQATWDEVCGERGLHGMHHKCALQEKSKLMIDLKRLEMRRGGPPEARCWPPRLGFWRSGEVGGAALTAARRPVQWSARKVG